MKKTKLYVLGMITSVVFFWGTVGLIILMGEIGQLSEENTTEFSASVIKVEVSEADPSADVYINEYEASLFLTSTVCERIKLSDLRDLKAGDEVYFRIEDSKGIYLNTAAFVDVVSLRTESQSFYSIQEYNSWMRDASIPAKISAYGFALLSLFVFLFCFFTVKMHVLPSTRYLLVKTSGYQKRNGRRLSVQGKTELRQKNKRRC